jgi:NAD(P)H-hydrate repair Nnr-like enzyme with NAD(P)H-hydrate dehydratase domain
VIDADAIGLVGEPSACMAMTTILTPHEGEFSKLFGDIKGPSRSVLSKPRGVAIGNRSEGRHIVAGLMAGWVSRRRAPAWLATAGTGRRSCRDDRRASGAGMDPFEAACAAVWFMVRAAE